MKSALSLAFVMILLITARIPAPSDHLWWVVWWGGAAWSAFILTVDLQRLIRYFSDTSRIYRKFPLSEAIYIFSLRVRHESILEYVGLLSVISAMIIGSLLQHHRLPETLYVAVFLGQLSIWVDRSIPPAVLILGTSQWECSRLITRVSRGVWPYRMAFLFEPARMTPSRQSPLQRMHFENGNLRLSTGKREDWLDVVHQLSRSVPFIVLDSRVASPAVVAETEHLIQSSYHRKLVVISDDEGRTPSLVAAMGARLTSPSLRIARASGAVAALAEMGLTGTRSPDEMPALSEIFANVSQRKLSRAQNAACAALDRLEGTLNRTDYVHGQTDFSRRVRRLIERVEEPRAAVVYDDKVSKSMSAISELPEDIETIEQFWEDTPATFRKQRDSLYIATKVYALYDALCRLQSIVDSIPPVLWKQDIDELIAPKRQ